MFLVLFKSYRRKIFPVRPENISGLTGRLFPSGGKEKDRKIFPVRELFPVSGRRSVIRAKILANGKGDIKPICAVKPGAFSLDQPGFPQRVQTAANGAFRAAHLVGKVFLFVYAIRVIAKPCSRIAWELPRVQSQSFTIRAPRNFSERYSSTERSESL